MAGVVVGLMAGSSGVAAATEDLGGCIYYAPGEDGGPTKCPGWKTNGKALSRRDFTNADLRDALFNRADLRNTNFTDANLSGAIALAPNMNAATQLRGAIVDGDTYFEGLVETQEVTPMSGAGTDRYVIIGAVHPGFPARFRPPTVPRGVSIDECRSASTVTVPTSANGQHVDLRVLRPGRYALTCTFFTADRPNGKGTTSFFVKVNDNLPAGPSHS